MGGKLFSLYLGLKGVVNQFVACLQKFRGHCKFSQGYKLHHKPREGRTDSLLNLLFGGLRFQGLRNRNQTRSSISTEVGTNFLILCSFKLLSCGRLLAKCQTSCPHFLPVVGKRVHYYMHHISLWIGLDKMNHKSLDIPFKKPFGLGKSTPPQIK